MGASWCQAESSHTQDRKRDTREDEQEGGWWAVCVWWGVSWLETIVVVSCKIMVQI